MGVLDSTDHTPRPQTGKNGSGYVVPTDANGAPITLANPLPVKITDASIVVNATIPGTVEINNDSGNPIPTTGSVKASDGTFFDPSQYDQVLNYTGTQLNYVQVVVGAATYRQTLTYTLGQLTGVSKWTLQ